MLRYSLKVSHAEKALILASRAVRFGELFGVELNEVAGELPSEWIEASANETDLLQQIRAGNTHIDVLTVHQGEPVLIENDLILNGFRCRKKTKLPLEHE
jgi:hypothetical protein